jgi:ribulose-5-phosphate 4-epimerase/fuculose-1-phosphate aldolase
MQEKEIKKQLEQAYKILAQLKLDDHTYTHLSARFEDSFFIYPFGMRFEEVDSDSLMKVSLDGVVLEGSEFQYNETGYQIHKTIYQNRPELNFIFHIHTPEIVAVSACKRGLLPISQWALHFYGRINYHAYNSLITEENQSSQLIKDLGNKKVLLLRNHGSITCAETVYEAMFWTYHLQKACETQCLALAMGEDLEMPSHEICLKTNEDIINFEKDLGKRDWDAWVRFINKKI